MLYYFSNFQDYFGPFRLFHFVTFRAAGALFTSIIIVFLFAPLSLKLLHKFRTYSSDRLDGLISGRTCVEKKNKTPIMGGLLIIFSITISTLLWGQIVNPFLPLFLLTLLAFGGLGFFDDYMKIKRSRGGVSGKFKLCIQFVIASAAVIALFLIPISKPYMYQVMIPFLKYPVLFGAAGAVGTAVLGVSAMMGASNAVNLTDGEDGLAVGCSIFCVLVYAALAYFCGHKFFAEYLSIPFIPGSGEVAIFAASLVGACMGFLWFNCHPALMFMGDTGSLALGGSIGLIAVLVKQELLLLLAGGVFVIEAGSVIIQVASVKLRGKKVFLMTPIHHHFEHKKWKEEKIVVRFWILAGIFALAALATLKIR